MTSRRDPRSWSTRYPPLAGLAIIVLLLVVLPSSLVQPQANPSTTLEYAPVPPDRNAAPPGGNIGSLGLGSSPTLGGGLGGQLPGQGGALPGSGANILAKRCVGTPLRQTEDPLSPPCVGYFNGDNGGSTYQGVSSREVKVAIYIDGDPNLVPKYCQKYIDLASLPEDDPGSSDDMWPRFRALYLYERYFNFRFQTYNRYVKLLPYVTCYDENGETSPETRRSEAADIYSRIHPFASVDLATSYIEEYQSSLARHGVMNFGGWAMGKASYHRTYPGLLWTFLPTFERQATLYSSYVCKKVVPYRVSFGNPDEEGEKRVLGMLYTRDKAFPEQTYLADLVERQVEACGGDVVVRVGSNWTRQSATNGYDSTNAATNIATLRRNGVTTILWTAMQDIPHSSAAAAVGYTPEVIVLGQWGWPGVDNLWPSDPHQSPAFWSHSWAVSNYPLLAPRRQQMCGQALLEQDPDASEFTLSVGCLEQYDHLFQLFSGIQVAGPRLSATSVEAGFRAIPPHPSKDPTTVACFYERNDYSCVKDAQAMWWDPSGRSANGDGVQGCWRSAEKGKRYLVGTWPQGDVTEQRGENDLCNNTE